MALRTGKFPWTSAGAAKAIKPLYSHKAVTAILNRGEWAHNNLQAFVEGTRYENQQLHHVLRDSRLNASDRGIFNSAATVFNTSFSMSCVMPEEQARENFRTAGEEAKGGSMALIPGSLRDAVVNSPYLDGSVEGLKNKFLEEAMGLEGCGFVWLFHDQAGSLRVEAWKNADTPVAADCVPLLALNLWQHAYFDDFRNDRKAYVEKFWKCVDWNFANSQLMVMVD